MKLMAGLYGEFLRCYNNFYFNCGSRAAAAAMEPLPWHIRLIFYASKFYSFFKHKKIHHICICVFKFFFINFWVVTSQKISSIKNSVHLPNTAFSSLALEHFHRYFFLLFREKDVLQFTANCSTEFLLEKKIVALSTRKKDKTFSGS